MNGANVNATDETKSTALHDTIKYGISIESIKNALDVEDSTRNFFYRQFSNR